MQQYKGRIICHGQERFIPAMQSLFNIWKSLNVKQYIKSIENKNHSVDTGKSFDKVIKILD